MPRLRGLPAWAPLQQRAALGEQIPAGAGIQPCGELVDAGETEHHHPFAFPGGPGRIHLGALESVEIPHDPVCFLLPALVFVAPALPHLLGGHDGRTASSRGSACTVTHTE